MELSPGEKREKAEWNDGDWRGGVGHGLRMKERLPGERDMIEEVIQ